MFFVVFFSSHDSMFHFAQVINTVVHRTTIIASLSKALNPYIAPMVLCCGWHSHFFNKCLSVSVCVSLVVPANHLRVVAIKRIYSYSDNLDGWWRISTTVCMPCKIGIWIPSSCVIVLYCVIPLFLFIIAWSSFLPPSAHLSTIHPNIHPIHPLIIISSIHQFINSSIVHHCSGE